jgi:hypothetical protein
VPSLPYPGKVRRGLRPGTPGCTRWQRRSPPAQQHAR